MKGDLTNALPISADKILKAPNRVCSWKNDRTSDLDQNVQKRSTSCPTKLAARLERSKTLLRIVQYLGIIWKLVGCIPLEGGAWHVRVMEDQQGTLDAKAPTSLPQHRFFYLP